MNIDTSESKCVNLNDEMDELASGGTLEHGRMVAESLLRNALPAGDSASLPHDYQCHQAAAKVMVDDHAKNSSDSLTFPPGLAGQLAEYIFFNSYLAVPEVAIAATLGVLSGVCGRAFETPTNSDLALYLILVARSGIGKDGIHDGIPKLLQLAGVQGAEYFVRQQDFASGPALHKELLASPGFLNLQGEFGRKLKSMSEFKNAPMQELRTIMTKCYAKDYFEGKSYSDAEKTMQGVRWPALSFLGETTPSTFAEALTSDMMEDGFMSRFIVINHTGLRPEPNLLRGQFQLSKEALEGWRTLIVRALPYRGATNVPGNRVAVGFKYDEARDKLSRFELQCGQQINLNDDEAERQVLNRAALKAWKVASLLAAADNPIAPQIDLGHAAWAILLVRHDISRFATRRRNGEVGSGDDARIRKIFALIKKFIAEPPAPSYKIPEVMHKKGVIPRSFFQMQVSTHAAFNNHKNGQSAALESTLRSMVDNGYLVELKKEKVFDDFGVHSRCYRVVSIPDWAQ